MNEDEWRKNNWRCNHGWLRGEQCEICNAPQRPWVGLTDEEIQKSYEEAYKVAQGRRLEVAFARVVETKLKEKNFD